MCVEDARGWIGNVGRASGDLKDGVYDVWIGDVGGVAPGRDPDIVDEVTEGRSCPRGTELGDGVAGMSQIRAADWIFEQFSSARRVYRSLDIRVGSTDIRG